VRVSICVYTHGFYKDRTAHMYGGYSKDIATAHDNMRIEPNTVSTKSPTLKPNANISNPNPKPNRYPYALIFEFIFIRRPPFLRYKRTHNGYQSLIP
jgi:hypothetical protein